VTRSGSGFATTSAGGDFARDYDDVVHGMSAYFAWANRNKESVALDLKHPRGQQALARLVQRADVVVQNLAPGAAARLGLDPAQLRASRPELITVDISGYGKGGPYARGRAYDLLIQSEVGSCAITGTAGQPAKPGIPLADIGAGMYALSSILAALWQRLARDVLHRPDLADDPRYAHNRDRVAHRAELDAVIGEWAAGLSLAECRKAAEAAGLGHARLNRPTELLSHPQLAERARWQEIGSPVGPLVGLLPPPESADWDWRLDPIPALGEHTEPVLKELGFSIEDLAAMRAEGVIGQAPAPDGRS
jgi:crotonobetainyl-CoA:carnitine CoA-transferase CaiB-like acyl-CoA transferase